MMFISIFLFNQLSNFNLVNSNLKFSRIDARSPFHKTKKRKWDTFKLKQFRENTL